MSKGNSQRGAFLGLAIGDALGAAVEFQPPGTFDLVTGYRAGGPHRLNPGEWTDDTSMALALADSLADVGWDLDDQAERYVRWWRGGEYSVNGRCFDIGITTSGALMRFLQVRDARKSGDRSERASGNGSIMRLAPVPIAYARLYPDRIPDLAEKALESSLPTHASPQCLSACAYFAVVLAGLIHGEPRETVLSPDWPALQELRDWMPLHPEIEVVALGNFRRKQPPEIQGSGYVVKSLEAALWAFHDARDFREAVLRAVNLGDDADTTGAVCGQLAGAYWGESGIPAEWLEGLARRDMIEAALAGLLEPVVKTSDSQPIPPPPPSAYWVVPGKLLAGAYPGHQTPAAHEKRIRDVLAAGVRVFLSLTEPDEKNRQGEPFVPYDHLACEWEPAAKCVRFPIRDNDVPTGEEMIAILDAIDGFVDAGETVYVHCWGGVGRTGTVVACWMLRRQMATHNTVLAKLAELRRQDKERGHREAPESAVQREFVRSWIE